MQQMRVWLRGRADDLGVLKPLVLLVWRASPRLFIALLALTLLGGLAPIGTMVVGARLLDAVIAAVRDGAVPSALLVLVGLFGALHVGSQLLNRMNNVVQGIYQKRVENSVQLMLVEKAGALDLAFFENPLFYNQLTNASNEAAFRPVMIVTQLMQLATLATTLISVVLVLLLWQPWVVPVIVIASALLFRTSARYNQSRFQMVVGRTTQMRTAQYYRAMLTSDWVAKEVRLFGLQPFLGGRYRRLLDQIYGQDVTLARRELLHVGAVELLLACVYPLLFGFAVYQAALGRITIGEFTLYNQSMWQLAGSLHFLTLMLSQLYENRLFIANLFLFLSLEPLVERPRPFGPALATPPARAPRIELRSVSFCYPHVNNPVLHDLSFVIEPGETVALVGVNGAGKTTLVKLLAGLYQPTGGQILLDGVDTTSMDRAALRERLGVILQDYIIYHFSAYDNIALGRAEALDDRERVLESARQSGFDRVAAAMPQGYETILGRFFELGYELSGGQRQLVALTRALMRRAPLLILDEPSAALDVYAEQRFFEQVLDEHRARNQTILFISHRFSTVRRADRILVLEHGRLIEEGPHSELMARGGRYAEMFIAQAQLYRPEMPEPPVAGLAHEHQPQLVVGASE
ncbi:MAG TPA: ABC transporter ATP-binding protein [Roseiflexaceae bacterium]|nr:ABC transporter ATP-binding protein [Roseiflexaceae bacterium]